MKGVQILAISLLVVLVLLIGMGVGACGGGEVTPPPGEEEEEVPPPEEEEETALPEEEEEVPPPEEEEETPPPPETAPGKFEILSHSMSGNKVVSIQAKNTGGSIIDWVEVTVEFFDSAGGWLCSQVLYEYDVAPGQTYDFEVAVPCSPVTDYNIKVEEHYWGKIS